jgi:Na+/melibiose symporter-like transporter
MGVAITFPLLQAFGFLPCDTARNTPTAIRGLALIFVLLPIVFVIFAGLTMAGYRLSETRHKEIRKTLAIREIDDRQISSR